MGVGMELQPLQNLPIPAEKSCPGSLRPGLPPSPYMALGIASYFGLLESGWEAELVLEVLRVWPYYQHQPETLGFAGERVGAAPWVLKALREVGL